MSNYKDPNARGTFRDIIRDPQKKRGEAANEIAFIFREILAENQFSIEQWDVITERFYQRIYGDDRQQIAQSKVNLARGLAKDKLTWGRFMEAIFALGYDDYEISISMKNRTEENSKRYSVKVKNPYKARRRGDDSCPPLPSEGEV